MIALSHPADDEYGGIEYDDNHAESYNVCVRTAQLILGKVPSWSTISTLINNVSACPP